MSKAPLPPIPESDLTKLNNAVRECVNSLTRQSAEVDLRKVIAEKMKEELNISTSDFNQLVKDRSEEHLTEKIAHMESILDLNDRLIQHQKRNSVSIAEADAEEEAEDSVQSLQDEAQD